MTNTTKTNTRSLSVVGLFAGIGGIELGLNEAGHSTKLLCEIEPAAQAVLSHNFADIPLHQDVTTLRSIPRGTDLIAAGFPCQDISLAGTRAGLGGGRSGLVWEVFRLAEKNRTELILLENVQHLLRLHSGENLRVVLDALEELNYRWAYRVVDSRGFGLPQRRQRVIILASRGDLDPASVLFAQAVIPEVNDTIELVDGHAYGFYWTEGKRGVGWARDAVPTIKGGSGLGIPSPPAVYDTATQIAGTPTIEDAERLQGFPAGWTDVSLNGLELKAGARWKLVGNAVSTPLGQWLGRTLADPRESVTEEVLSPLDLKRAWPDAAAFRDGRRFKVDTTQFVEVSSHVPIVDFLCDPLKPLSTKALLGYISRAREGSKKFPLGFLENLEIQARKQDYAA